MASPRGKSWISLNVAFAVECETLQNTLLEPKGNNTVAPTSACSSVLYDHSAWLSLIYLSPVSFFQPNSWSSSLIQPFNPSPARFSLRFIVSSSSISPVLDLLTFSLRVGVMLLDVHARYFDRRNPEIVSPTLRLWHLFRSKPPCNWNV